MQAKIIKDNVITGLFGAIALAEVAFLGPISVWLVAAAAVPTALAFDHWHAKTLGLSRRTVVDRLTQHRTRSRASNAQDWADDLNADLARHHRGDVDDQVWLAFHTGAAAGVDIRPIRHDGRRLVAAAAQWAVAFDDRAGAWHPEEV
jgi:hypothetical protein